MDRSRGVDGEQPDREGRAPPLPRSSLSSHYRGGGGEAGAARATVAARTFCAALHAGRDGPAEPAALTRQQTSPRSRSHGLLRIWIGANGRRRVFTHDAAVARARRSVRATG